MSGTAVLLGVVIDYERVERLCSGPRLLPTEEEQLAYLAHDWSRKITGWDDPEMDIYNDMK